MIPLLSRNVGFGMGLEFREGTHVLPTPGSGKAAAAGEGGAPRVRPGMVFNVCVGVAGLTNPEAADPKARNYALQVGSLPRGGRHCGWDRCTGRKVAPVRTASRL